MFEEVLKKYRVGILNDRFSNLKHAKDGTVSDNLSKIVLHSDGSTLRFSDINYDEQDNAVWRANDHLHRLKTLAIAYKNDDKRVDLKVLQGLLDFWLATDAISDNWWFNMIGAPTELSVIAVLLWDDIGFKTRTLMLSRISRGVIFFKSCMNQWEHFCGANMLWMAFTTMTYAILTDDLSLFKFSIILAEGEVVFGKEGPQPDGSFFQHGPRLYSGAYGQSYLSSLATMIHIAGMTPYALSKDSMEVVMTHIDGIKYMINRSYWDYTALGRAYVRSYNPMNAKSLISVLELIATNPHFHRVSEIEQFIEALKKDTPTFDGVRLFPKAAYLTMCKDGVFISHKSAAPDVLNAEIINNENVLGYNLSYGTHTAVISSGREYADAVPTWDYGLIPGTSTPYMTECELLSVDDFYGRYLDVKNYTAKSFGDVAVIRTNVKHEGVSATVAAFATPFGMIILGNSLFDEKGREIITTVEQCAVTGEVKILSQEIIHGAVKYKSLELDSKFVSSVEMKKGSYKRNSLCESDEVVERKMLTVTLNRNGKNSYAYVIAPITVDLNGLEVVRNDNNQQSVKLPDGRVITV